MRADNQGQILPSVTLSLRSAPASNPHNARCPVSAQLPATSCLGAFRTPATSSCGGSRDPGVRKPRQQETKMPVVLLREADNDGSGCKGWAGVLSYAREVFRFRRRIRLGRTLQYLYIDRAQCGEHSR